MAVSILVTPPPPFYLGPPSLLDGWHQPSVASGTGLGSGAGPMLHLH